MVNFNHVVCAHGKLYFLFAIVNIPFISVGFSYLFDRHLALTEAAERFKELQTEKEMRQLQEDRKNDKKPPPYRHIRVQVFKHFCSACFFGHFIYFQWKIQPTASWPGEPADWEGADHHGRPLWDPALQLQGLWREPVRPRLGVHQPHADVRVPPPGVRCRGAVPEPGLHQAPVQSGGDLQNAVLRLGFACRVGHQEGSWGWAVPDGLGGVCQPEPEPHLCFLLLFLFLLSGSLRQWICGRGDRRRGMSSSHQTRSGERYL